MVLVLAGCGGSSAGSGGGSDTGGSGVSSAASNSGTGSSGSGSSDAGSAPATEGSGPETPQSAQPGGPSLTVVSLPVGGSATPDGSNTDQQCGSVSWRLDSIPDGVTVQLGDVSLSPSGIFDLGGSGCGSDQTVCSSGLTWTAASSGCAVPVTQTDPSSSGTVTIEVPGVINCPSQAVCDDLRGELGDLAASHSQAFVTAVPHSSSDSSSSAGSPGSSDTSPSSAGT